MSNKPPSSKSKYSDETVVLIGVAAMLLATVLYLVLGFAPDM
jgi:hypothetical protein